MFSILAWSGNLPACASSFDANKLQVFSKLNSKFVGVVDNCFAQGGVTWEASYRALRDLQDQVALFLKHEYLPPRYLVLYVGDVRLTKPDFPYVDKLDPNDYLAVANKLHNAQSINVVYHIDQDVARASVRRKGLYVQQVYEVDCFHLGVLKSHDTHTQERGVYGLPELDFWATRRVQKLSFGYNADNVGDLGNFPYLTSLEICWTSSVKEVHLKSFASCKFLTTLKLRLHGDLLTLDGIGDLVNLQELSITAVTTCCAKDVLPCLTIPTEVGKLSKLSKMGFFGRKIYGSIPAEIGRLSRLYALSIAETSLDCVIPTELSLMNLTFLNLKDNPTLRGSINLPGAEIYLSGTPHVQDYQNRVKTYQITNW